MERERTGTEHEPPDLTLLRLIVQSALKPSGRARERGMHRTGGTGEACSEQERSHEKEWKSCWSVTARPRAFEE